MAEHVANVEHYLATLPPPTRAALEQVRAAVHEALPGGTEVISHQIPTVQVDGRSVVHFAGWARHLSLYPVPDGDPDLLAELAPYLAGRGTLRFPLSRPLPLDLVRRTAARLALERAPGPG